MKTQIVKKTILVIAALLLGAIATSQPSLAVAPVCPPVCPLVAR
jgi:hypothetical protein